MGLAAVYLNEATVRSMAVKEVDGALNCALSSGTDVVHDADETRRLTREAVTSYCLWGNRIVRVTDIDVRVTDVKEASNRVRRSVDLRVKYRTGEIVPADREAGRRVQVTFDPGTGQFTSSAPTYLPLP